MLRAAGYLCQLHDDHFDQSTEDAVWLGEVAAKNWIVLTKDERIRYRPLEIRALELARLRTFIMVGGNLRGSDMANILVKAMPAILKLVEARSGPFIYYIYKNSTLKAA